MNNKQKLNQELEKWYTPAEAKEYLNCHHYNLISWAEAGLITRIRLDDRRSLYLKKDVHEMKDRLTSN